MSKRFTDTEKWRNPWFRKLSPTYKALWMYIVDSCDNAGVWMVDVELASFSIGEQVDAVSALGMFDGRIIAIGDGKRWLVRDFVTYQYGANLNPESRVHAQVLALQQKHGLEYVGNSLSDRLSDSLKDKDKDKDKDKEYGIVSEENGVIQRARDRLIPDLIRVKAEFVINGSDEEEAERFFNHYDAQDWKSGNGQAILKWQAKAKVWISEQRKRSDADAKGKRRGDRNADGSIDIVNYARQVDDVVDAAREARRSARRMVQGIFEKANALETGDLGQGDQGRLAGIPP